MTADLIDRLRFLASGQDDIRSQALDEAANALERAQAPAEAHGDERFSIPEIAEAAQYADVPDAYFRSMLIALGETHRARKAKAQPKVMPGRDWLEGMVDAWRASAEESTPLVADAFRTCAADLERALRLNPREATQAPAPAPATGDTNGRRDGLRSAVHGRVAVGGYTPGALADLLWASPDVMSLNAELGLSMDQLAQLTQAVLTAVPCAAVVDGEPAAWIRWEWNRSGGKSLEFFKPDELSLADEARGVVYDPLYGRPLAPLSERAILDLVPSTMPIANDFDLLWFARAVERAHGIDKGQPPVQHKGGA